MITETMRVEKLVYGGDGIGRLADGRAAFVPFVLPDELVSIAIVEDRGKFVRGKLVEILEPSPKRITPKCTHFTLCGGCHYQHMDHPDQLAAKESILREQITRGTGLTNLPFSGIHPSPQPFNYRNHIQFHVDPTGRLGFMDVENRSVLPIQECHLPLEGIRDLWPQIDLDSGANISRVNIRQDSLDELMLLLEGSLEEEDELEFSLPVSACLLDPDGRLQMLSGEDSLTFEILGESFTLSPASFFQVNTPVAEEMVRAMLTELEGQSNLRVLELYAGAGLFTRFLAPHARQITAIESSPSACYDFADNLDEYNHISLYEGPVEQVLPALVSELGKIDLVVLDPPRAGLHPNARKALAKLQPEKILYFSCDPSTLARDLDHLLKSGYGLAELQAFDMFPQTYHIETCALLSNHTSSKQVNVSQ